MWLTNPDESRGLSRQSLLIAGLCTVGDLTLSALVLTSDAAAGALSSPLTWVALVTILLVDLSLALPARTAGGVAVLHGLVRCASAALLWQASGVHDLGTGNSTGLVVAGYRAGAWTAGRRSWVALGALVTGMTGAQLIQGDVIAAGPGLTTVANTVLPWLMGRYTTGRAGHIAQVEREAATQRHVAREQLGQALAAERGAIARDLHDTISHHVSAIGIHAAAGRLALAARDRSTGTRVLDGPRRVDEPAARALDQIERCSQGAMTDLRRMLDLLAGHNSDGERQPGLADLDNLVDGSRRAGLDVRVDVQDLRPSELPPSLQLCAYRIIQEMLTNGLRHGDGGLVLSVLRTEATLTICALNALGPSDAATPGTGHGLDGIRRRVGVFGGSCTSGPSTDGRTWQTRADLPLESR